MTDGTRRFDRTWVNALLSPKRLGQFISVGAAGVVVDLATLLVLTEGFDVSPYIAGLVSIEAAILVMFLINEHWTFAEVGADGRRSLLWRAVRSHAVRAAGSTTQYLIYVAILSQAGGPVAFLTINVLPVIAKVVGISVGMVVNYTFESLFTWRVHVDEN